MTGRRRVARSRVRRLAFGCAALLAAGAAARAGLGAQAPTSPSSAQQTFRAATVVVEVDTIVTDSQGRFVPDLTSSDFEVLEDGGPQAIQSVYLVTAEGVRAVPAPSGTATTASAVAAPPPPRAGRLFILFFDEQHVDPGAFKRLQTAAEAFLKAEFREADIGGVLVGTRMAGNRLTSNRDELLAAVRQAKPSATRGMLKLDLQDWPRITEAEAIRIAINFDKNVLKQAVARAEREAPDGRQRPDYEPNVLEKARYVVGQLRIPARNTLTAFAGLVNGLSRLPGRKTVVFMTDGFFIEEAGDAVRQIVGAAARANVRVYSIDAQGQNRRRQDTSLNAMMPMDTGGAIPAGAYDTTEDAPNSLAVDTGGLVIRNTNDFTSAMRDIARDTSQYYVLGYLPSNTNADGKFRSITVRVNRPGLKVRARKGYVAVRPGEGEKPPGAAPGAGDTAPAPAATATPERPPATPEKPAAGTPLPDERPRALASEAPVPAASLLADAGLSMRPDSRTRVEALAGAGAAAPTLGTPASRGWDAYSKGDLEGAALLLAQAAADSGSPPWVSYALGFAEIGLGRAAKAADAWERVRAAVPEFKDVWLDLADARLRLDDLGGAIALLRQAEARWRGDAELLNALGTLEVRRGTLDAALATFKKATQSAPADALAYFNLARTYEVRYYRTRRYSPPGGAWVGNKSDVAAPLENYERYLKIGGPFEEQARALLERLQWMK